MTNDQIHYLTERTFIWNMFRGGIIDFDEMMERIKTLCVAMCLYSSDFSSPSMLGTRMPLLWLKTHY
ncbi:MAG: hypothetical protein AAGJ37_13415, partial [Pseudomonadota bacterium]